MGKPTAPPRIRLTRRDRRSIRRSVRLGTAVEDPRLAEPARRRAAVRVEAARHRWVHWLPMACSSLLLLALFLPHRRSALGIARGSVGALGLCLAAWTRARFATGTERARRAVEANGALLDRRRPASDPPRILGFWDPAELAGLAAAAPVLLAMILAVPELAFAWIGIAVGVINLTAGRLQRRRAPRPRSRR
jgi:hypothetical protein